MGGHWVTSAAQISLSNPSQQVNFHPAEKVTSENRILFPQQEFTIRIMVLAAHRIETPRLS
jgi:hypothetical protein